jgi:hypothetical protein
LQLSTPYQIQDSKYIHTKNPVHMEHFEPIKANLNKSFHQDTELHRRAKGTKQCSCMNKCHEFFGNGDKHTTSAGHTFQCHLPLPLLAYIHIYLLT